MRGYVILPESGLGIVPDRGQGLQAADSVFEERDGFAGVEGEDVAAGGAEGEAVALGVDAGEAGLPGGERGGEDAREVGGEEAWGGVGEEEHGVGCWRGRR